MARVYKELVQREEDRRKQGEWRRRQLDGQEEGGRHEEQDDWSWYTPGGYPPV